MVHLSPPLYTSKHMKEGQVATNLISSLTFFAKFIHLKQGGSQHDSLLLLNYNSLHPWPLPMLDTLDLKPAWYHYLVNYRQDYMWIIANKLSWVFSRGIFTFFGVQKLYFVICLRVLGNGDNFQPRYPWHTMHVKSSIWVVRKNVPSA